MYTCAMQKQPSGHHIITIDLYRDGEDAPWGFRLKGGIDVDGGTPLEITKVGETGSSTFHDI